MVLAAFAKSEILVCNPTPPLRKCRHDQDKALDHVATMYLLISISLVLLLLIHLRPRVSPPVPSVPWHEYLPFGLAFAPIRDSRTWVRSLDALAVRYGDLFTVRFTVSKLLITAVPADISQILCDDAFRKTSPVRFAFSLVFPQGLLALEKQAHAGLRRHLRQNFNAKLLPLFHARMREAIIELRLSLRRAATTGQIVDISQLLSLCTFHVIAAIAFDAQPTHAECKHFAHLLDKWSSAFTFDVARMGMRMRMAGKKAQFSKELRDATEQLHEICRQFIDRRRQTVRKREPDVLDSILELNEEAALSLVLEFAVAGVVTTAPQLAWGVFELCRNPAVVKRMRYDVDETAGETELLSFDDIQSMKYVEKVWKEVCRLKPVSLGFIRTTTRDVTLRGSGVRLEKGSGVWAHSRRAQTHPEIWKEPLEFRPERWEERVPLGAFSPFGMGGMNCFGQFLANHEGKLLLAEMWRDFDFEVACDEVVGCTLFSEMPRSGPGLQEGVLVRVRTRGESVVQ